MNSDRNWNRIWTIFEDAIALEDPAARRRLVGTKCGRDAHMKREVLSLIEAHGQKSFLDAPAYLVTAPAIETSVGPYELIDEIGRGGMGVVFRARDRRLDRLVALKMLPGHLLGDEDARARLMAEARAAARLEHPHIATVYDVGEAPDGRLYLAMALYEGETLEHRIARGPFDAETAYAVVAQIAKGLDSAHAAGIVHRDIKPANILITTDDVVKILDFGIAKVADLELTQSGTKIGTIAYMSPEQTRGQLVDGRSDVWSLGVVLFEMLTGRRPFEGTYADGVLYAIRHEPAPAPSTVRSDLPPILDVVLGKALAKEVEDRFDTAGALVQAVVANLSSVPPIPENPPLSSAPERVRATVLASRLLGYVELVDQLAPHEMDTVSTELRRCVSDVVDRNGGLVHEMDGESFVALFGIRHVHEDDFVRAVRTARSLHEDVAKIAEKYRRRTNSPLRLATGVDTGALVAQVADGALRVTGDAMQLARQLSDQADPDELLVSPECGRLIRPFFATSPRGEVHVRTANRSFTPLRVLGETGSETRIEAAQITGLTDYAGRDREMTVLLEGFEQMLEGSGHTIDVVGDAGMGKSRLLHEFHERIAGRARVLCGRCVPHGGKLPYLPFSGVLRGHLDLTDERIDDDAIVERVRAVDESLEIFLPFYCHLLSVESERFPIPDHQKQEDMRMAIVEAIAGIFTLGARRNPLVLLLEDWHWSDDASREVLKQLAELAPAFPMLVVVTYRSEYEEERTGQHAYVHLTPLGLEATTTMIQSVVGAGDIPDDLAELIHRRTGGNPFFLEEVCRALLEEGVLSVENDRAVMAPSFESLDLPDTVQAVIRTRLHRLGPSARKILRTASVVGREFSGVLMRSILPDQSDLPSGLDALSRLGLIQKTAVVPEVTFRFKHALTQEVVYDTLLHHQRKVLHGEVGAALEELMADRAEEHVDMFVHHFSRAEDWLKAARYARQAARRAMRLGQFPEAGVILAEAVDWLQRLPLDEISRSEYLDALMELERVCETTGDRSRQQEIIDEMLALLQQGGDRAVLAEVYRRQGDLHVLRRRLTDADHSLAAAMQLAHTAGDDDVRRRILRSLGFLRWNEGRSAEAIALNEQVLTLHREAGDDRAVIGDLVNLCIIARDDGNYESALAYLEQAREVLERTNTPSVDAYIYHSVGMLHHLIGESERALEYLEVAAAMAEEHRLPLQHSFDLMSMANIYMIRGEVERSLDCYREAIELTRRSRYADGLAKSLRVFGQVLLGLQRYDEALPVLNESIDWFRQLDDRTSEAEILVRVADVYEERGEIEPAEAAWQRISELLENLDTQFEVDTIEAFARLARRRGNDAEALSFYHDAIELLQHVNDISREARLRNVAGILSWTSGAIPEALSHFERALPLFVQADDEAGIGLMHNSIAACMCRLNRPSDARRHLAEALVVHRRSGETTMEAHALALLGDAERATDCLDDALRSYADSLQLRWDLGDRNGEAWMLLRLAQTHAARAETERAREYADQALVLAHELADEPLKHACDEILS